MYTFKKTVAYINYVAKCNQNLKIMKIKRERVKLFINAYGLYLENDSMSHL